MISEKRLSAFNIPAVLRYKIFIQLKVEKIHWRKMPNFRNDSFINKEDIFRIIVAHLNLNQGPIFMLVA